MTMAQETQNIQVGSQVQPRSLLTARRPSISVHNDTFSSFNSRDAINSALRNETLPAIDSDEEDGPIGSVGVRSGMNAAIVLTGETRFL